MKCENSGSDSVWLEPRSSPRNFAFVCALNLSYGAGDGGICDTLCRTVRLASGWCRTINEEAIGRHAWLVCGPVLLAPSDIGHRAELAEKSEKGTRRYCSSCKCTKHAAHFIGKKKSCIQCLTKRRLANSAQRGNSWQGDSSLESPLQELLTNIMPRESFKVATDDWMQTLMHGATCQLLFESIPEHPLLQ